MNYPCWNVQHTPNMLSHRWDRFLHFHFSRTFQVEVFDRTPIPFERIPNSSLLHQLFSHSEAINSKLGLIFLKLERCTCWCPSPYGTQTRNKTRLNLITLIIHKRFSASRYLQIMRLIGSWYAAFGLERFSHVKLTKPTRFNKLPQASTNETHNILGDLQLSRSSIKTRFEFAIYIEWRKWAWVK